MALMTRRSLKAYSVMAFFGSRTARQAHSSASGLDIITLWGLDSEQMLRQALPRTFQHSLALEPFTVAEVDTTQTNITAPLMRLLQDFGIRSELVQFLVFVLATEPELGEDETAYQVKIVCVVKSMYEVESRRYQPFIAALQSPWADSALRPAS